jgi:phosphatidylserine decarboxylase
MVKQHGDGQDIPKEHRVHRHGAWLPADRRIQREWLSKQIEHVDAHGAPAADGLTPALREFRALIEDNPRVYMYFSQMWDEVPRHGAYAHDPTGKRRQIRDYGHMLAVLNHVLRKAPEWTDAAFGVGMVGVPMCSIFDYVMATPSGHAAFLDPEVNAMLKKVLNEWGRYLQTPESAGVLGTHKEGWFGPHATQDLMEVANAPLGTSHAFADMFVCDPAAANHGFKSWDDFFTRQLRPGVRPVASPDDDAVVANCCESRVYNVARGARLRDRFWAKGQPYSVLDMLGHDALAQQFAGATVYQAFLSALSYHRWHAPVSGIVVRAFVREGTYFSEPLQEAEEAEDAAGAAKDAAGGDAPADATAADRVAIDRRGITIAQGYLTALATRAVIFIEADNPDIGLMAFVGVGMDEVSTCEITVREGQHVAKGDQTGMFHFGGSTHCLLFRAGVDVGGFPDVGRQENVPVRGPVAVVGRSRDGRKQ